MQAQAAQVRETAYKFTAVQFEQMVTDGVFSEEDHVELIDGNIIEMSPINHPHAAVVSNLEFILRERLGRAAYVWAQQPLLVDQYSRPQPDVMALKWRDDRYIPAPPTPADVLLIIEVSDTSLLSDRGWEHTKYASAGIPEYWIVDVKSQQVEVYSGLEGGSYKSKQIAKREETLPLSWTGTTMVSVSEIFGLK